MKPFSYLQEFGELEEHVEEDKMMRKI